MEEEKKKKGKENKAEYNQKEMFILKGRRMELALSIKALWK